MPKVPVGKCLVLVEAVGALQVFELLHDLVIYPLVVLHVCPLLLAPEHPTPPRPGLYALLSLSCGGVGLSLLGCGLPGSGYTPVGESVQPVHRKARAGVASDVSGLQQFID